jgi:hypothetical protein
MSKKSLKLVQYRTSVMLCGQSKFVAIWNVNVCDVSCSLLRYLWSLRLIAKRKD